ncbi:hypothetical protein Pcinc_006038 [Petrolisthes cinctipes]|uniref:Uncharacterized protein n=1 Tax=Petrolisthes cinctipes TaxID=88211 RepID=A0AAE1KYQ6_PETCI|nr:hypothetical protein Pcinc_006038 [Petrolisthes cinctipes]
MKHLQTKHPLQYAACKGETSATSPDTPAECPESTQSTTTTRNQVQLQQTFHDIVAKKDGYKEEVPERRNLNSSLDDRERLTAHVHSRRHVKATDKLSEVQERTGVQQKKLIIDVDTRWNSTYCMMERFLEQHKVTTTTLCLLGKSNMCLNGDELEVGSDTLRTN